MSFSLRLCSFYGFFFTLQKSSVQTLRHRQAHDTRRKSNDTRFRDWDFPSFKSLFYTDCIVIVVCTVENYLEFRHELNCRLRKKMRFSTFRFHHFSLNSSRTRFYIPFKNSKSAVWYNLKGDNLTCWVEKMVRDISHEFYECQRDFWLAFYM